MAEPVLAFDAVSRIYKQAGADLPILTGASFAIAEGEIVALVGPSGAGKSTLLHLAGLLERPDAGTIKINGADTGRLSDRERTRLRREAIGFVYQFHHLLPEFSALENVVIPQMIAGKSKPAARERAQTLLDQVGLTERASHRPARLSGGEQQRVAIARAIANAPAILMADEPTGNLDPRTAGQVFDLLEDLLKTNGQAALIATHNMELAARAGRAITIRDGQTVAIDL